MGNGDHNICSYLRGVNNEGFPFVNMCVCVCECVCGGGGGGGGGGGRVFV